ncbi:hypothetical protein Hamer_G016523 [Homarus americanus]|uniref:Uncharacterized protein n=1 Tax=Homarus americanus TaxID=6706 RepID=A0A8J5MPL2_HOMAM|nr:hypothetical protein Hamer_G016523 [Homarus americanus]
MGGTPDHVLSAGLISDRIEANLVRHLILDHIAIAVSYWVPKEATLPIRRLHYLLPDHNVETLVRYMAAWYTSNEPQSVTQVNDDLTVTIKQFYSRFESQDHLKQKARPRTQPPGSWTPVYLKLESWHTLRGTSSSVSFLTPTSSQR